MTLEELVQALREDILDDLPGDSGVDWKTDDSNLLWSNDELVRFANKAHEEFCRRRPIEDNDDSVICRITLKTDVDTYEYDDRILEVNRIQIDGETRDLSKFTTEQLDENHPGWHEATSGTPLKYVEDRDERSIQLTPPPDSTFNGKKLILDVWRLPKESFVWKKRRSQKPEIKTHHHVDLLDYMAYLAYRKRDSQTQDLEAAASFLAQFNDKIGLRRTAHLESVNRKERNLRRRTRAYYF